MRHTLNVYCSYLASINARYWIFRHPFLKHLPFPYFWSDSIENLYSSSKRVEVVCYEVSCGYAALIKINDLLKLLQFFLHFKVPSEKNNVLFLPTKILWMLTTFQILCLHLKYQRELPHCCLSPTQKFFCFQPSKTLFSLCMNGSTCRKETIQSL